MDFDYLIKLSLLGDAGVGKTSFLLRYIEDTFTEAPLPRHLVGDFRIKVIKLASIKVKLQMWDIVEYSTFRYNSRNEFRRMHGFILVYDCCDRKSFEQCQDWIRDIERYSSGNEKILIIGNKCDKQCKKVVLEEEGKELAKGIQALFAETSTLQSINVEWVVAALINDILHGLEEKKIIEQRAANK